MMLEIHVLVWDSHQNAHILRLLPVMLLFNSFVLDPVSRLNQLECKINTWKQNVEWEKFEDAKGLIIGRKS